MEHNGNKTGELGAINMGRIVGGYDMVCCAANASYGLYGGLIKICV